MIKFKRTYDPASRGDGRRILVERLWPRGMKKQAVAAESWIKDVAPSTALRIWFGHREERWQEFHKRYEKELNANPAAWAPILEASARGTVTLLYSARDAARNGAVVLRDYLIRRQKRRGGLRARPESTPRTPRTVAAVRRLRQRIA